MRNVRGRSWIRSASAVAVRPRLWPTAAAQAVRLAPPGWWRRPPFVPWPDREYLRWRLRTQYGEGEGRGASAPAAGDVVTYLEWCRARSAERRRTAVRRR